MKPITNKIPKLYQQMINWTLAICWGTGIAFFVLSTWVQVEGEFGPEKHFLQIPSLQVHAASAFILMLFFGALFFGHKPRVSHMQHGQRSGNYLVNSFFFLIVSAYALYYIADQTWREYIGYAHLAVGLILPVILIVHIRSHQQYQAQKQR